MPWITVVDEWPHIEGPARTVVYQPGKHNVTADIAAAFEAREKTDDGAHNSDPAGGNGRAEGGADSGGAGSGGRDLSADDA